MGGAEGVPSRPVGGPQPWKDLDAPGYGWETEVRARPCERAAAQFKGGYYCHTQSEIDLVIPIVADSGFCGHGAGWWSTRPRVSTFRFTDGKALFMFFLPNGEIEYEAPPVI